MKLVRFDAGQGAELGILRQGIMPFTRMVPGAPAEMIALIEEWHDWQPILANLHGQELPLAEVRLLAPIARPGKILGIGLNYTDHIKESGMPAPSEQLWFSKAITTIAGPNDPIRLPRVSEQLDYEAELVTVIGRRVRYADQIQAKAAIFGYCAGNDVSIRDWQMRTGQFMLGKSFDSHAPIGPAIVTADSIDATSLAIECRINGEVRQSSNTRHLLFDPVAQVEHLSQVMTLEPGDILFSGTPGGVGAGFNPPRWLKANDRVDVEIEGIGKLSNKVVAD